MRALESPPSTAHTRAEVQHSTNETRQGSALLRFKRTFQALPLL